MLDIVLGKSRQNLVFVLEKLLRSNISILNSMFLSSNQSSVIFKDSLNSNDLMIDFFAKDYFKTQLLISKENGSQIRLLYS